MKTNELIGPPLDWAVAKCENETQIVQFSSLASSKHYYAPSRKWAQGGPIIERESISLTPCDDMESWAADTTFRQGVETQYGPTPLIAAMRCYVTSKLGDEVDIPEELK